MCAGPLDHPAVDGVIAIPLRLEETVGDGRFFWSELVVIDLGAGAVELIQLGTRVEYFGMLLHLVLGWFADELSGSWVNECNPQETKRKSGPSTGCPSG